MVKEMAHLVLFDIDGVIADDRHRQHFIPRWNAYFGDMAFDRVWPQAREIYDEYVEEADPATTLGYLTGRREDTRSITRRWLLTNGFGDHMLCMKPFGKVGKLAEFKVEILTGLRTMYDTVELFDDDPRVIKAVKEMGDPDIVAVHCTWHKKPVSMMQAAVA